MLTLPPVLAPHFFNPQRVYYPSQDRSDYIMAEYGNCDSGEHVCWYLTLDGDQGHGLDVCYRVRGNPFLISSLSYVASMAVGKSVDFLKGFDPQGFVDEVSLPLAKQYIAFLIDRLLTIVIEGVG